MKIKLALVMTAMLVLWLGLTAQAEDKVKIGPGGVEVESGGEKVNLTPGAVEVDDGTGNKVKVTAPAVEVEGSGEEEEEAGEGEAAEPPVKGLKKKAAIVCQGNDSREYSNIHITGAKNGVLIQGNCNITIKDSRIDVGLYGVNVQGNGDVKLVRTWVKGKKGAVIIMGNGDVTASGCTLIGGITKMGNGEFIDKGKNVRRTR